MFRILIVEDEEILREAYEMILKSGGYSVDVAHNGQEALEKSNSNHYNLILLDLMMPVLNGVGYLRQADLKSTSPATTVIAFSNLSSGSNIPEALKLGANRHVLKSDLSPQDLLQLVAGYSQ